MYRGSRAPHFSFKFSCLCRRTTPSPMAGRSTVRVRGRGHDITVGMARGRGAERTSHPSPPWLAWRLSAPHPRTVPAHSSSRPLTSHHRSILLSSPVPRLSQKLAMGRPARAVCRTGLAVHVRTAAVPMGWGGGAGARWVCVGGWKGGGWEERYLLHCFAPPMTDRR